MHTIAIGIASAMPRNRRKVNELNSFTISIPSVRNIVTGSGMITRPAATPIIISICLVLSNSRNMNKIRASPNNTILHSHEFLFGIMFLSTYELTNLHQCFLCFLVHCVFSFRTFIFSDEKKTLSPEIMFPKKVSRKSISYSIYYVSTSKKCQLVSVWCQLLNFAILSPVFMRLRHLSYQPVVQDEKSIFEKLQTTKKC